MNRGELNAAIKLEMETDPALVSDQERYRYINMAVADLASLGLFEKDSTLDVTANPTALPSDFISLREIYWVNGTSLQPLFPVADIPSTSTGTPAVYRIIANNLYLYPFATGQVRLIYSYRPQGIDETVGEAYDSSTPGIPEDWHSLIIPYAVAKCHLKSGSVARYQQYMQEYSTLKNMKVTEYARTFNSSYRTIKDYPLSIPEWY